MERWWRSYLSGGALVVAGYLAIPAGVYRDVVYVLLGLSCVAAVLRGVHVHRPSRRTPWYLMVAGLLSWVVGDAIYTWNADVANVFPFPSEADAFYLVAYPLMAASLAALIRIRRRGLDLAGLIDSAIVTIGLGLLSWVLLAGPVLNDPDSSLLVRVVGAAYPISDIVLLGLLVRLITTPGARTTSFRMLTSAVGLLLVADSVFALSASDTVSSGLNDLLWLASYVLWGTAALHPSMRTLSESGAERTAPFTSRRLVALTLTVLIAPCTLAAELVAGTTPDLWAIVVGSVALFLLVVGRMYVTFREITTATEQRDQLQGDLFHQAAHDALTSLANRAHVLELIESALHRGRRAGTAVGLLFIDLDHFKIVNDTLGHRAGDDVLRVAAQRMRRSVREGDTVGRFGGDEFVVLMEPLSSEADLVGLAHDLIAEISAPIETGAREVTISASVGVAVSADGSTDAKQLLYEADLATYRAKAAGRGRVEVFDEALRRELDTRARLESAMVDGLAGGEFVVHYQPVVAVGSGATVGYEALARWQRPEHGLLLPSEFIPAAEKSDLISILDRWVLRHATRQLAEWTAADPEACADLTMAVNISGRHLADPGIVAEVFAALQESSLHPSRLVLEITETVLIEVPVAAAHLRALRELGVSISIDDFGTGYTSIGQLHHLPIDTLKIDRSFVSSSAPGSHELVALMVNAAHGCGLQVIVEGVEHDDQLALLRKLPCDSAQGYLFARPQPAASMAGRSRALVVDADHESALT